MNRKAWAGLCLVVILLATWALGPVPAFAFTEVPTLTEASPSGMTEVKAAIGFTIQFDGGDGSGSIDPVLCTTREYELPDASAFTAPEGRIFKEWSVQIGSAEAVGKPVGAEITVTADTTVTAVWEEKDVARLNLITTSFKDKLQLNFYYKLPEAVVQDEGVYLQVTHDGTIRKIPVKNAELIQSNQDKAKVGCHLFSYSIEAKQARDNVNVRLFYGNDTPVETYIGSGSRDLTYDGYDISAMVYLDYMTEHGSDDMKALALATKDYCTAAQLHFKYKVDSIGADDGVRPLVDEVKSSDLSEYASVKTGELPEGVSLNVMTVMFETDNSFRLYYTFSDVNTRNSYSYAVDDSTVTLKQRSSDGAYYIEKRGVPARLLHKSHTYAVSKDGKTYTLTASMMTYAYVAMDYGTDSMKTLAKAFYLYNQAAKDKFGDAE